MGQRNYDIELAQMAANIAAGMVTAERYKSHDSKMIAGAAVYLAKQIVKPLEEPASTGTLTGITAPITFNSLWVCPYCGATVSKTDSAWEVRASDHVDRCGRRPRVSEDV